MQVYATLPEIYVTKKGLEKNKEIYVLSLASDRHGQSNHRPLAVGATNETLVNVSPRIATAMKFFAIAVSSLFVNIRPDQPPSLSGDGVVLYPPSDPKGMLALHFALVESDAGTRDVGSILEGIFNDKSVKKFLSEISKVTALSGNIPASLLTSLFGTITAVIPPIIKNNKDDILFSHNHSGVEFNGYGGSPNGASFRVGNDRAGATLRIWTRE